MDTPRYFTVVNRHGNVFRGAWELRGDVVTGLTFPFEFKQKVDAGAPIVGQLPTGWLEPSQGPWREVFTELPPDQAYPRIARPLLLEGMDPREPYAVYDQIVVGSIYTQLSWLTRALEELFRIVEPHQANLKCFGTGIRNLFVLAATEVEAQWRGVMLANSHKPKAWTTNEYVKLLPAMRLDEYEIDLPLFPAAGAFRPFEGWKSENATHSLGWFSEHHAAKHDREGNAFAGNLRNAIMAVAAVHVMATAQFGKWAIVNDAGLERIIRITRHPQWLLEQGYLVGSGEHGRNRLANYPF